MARIHIGFFSDALRMCTQCDVILPQKSASLTGMGPGARDGERYPVLWLLHGAGDDHTAWLRRTSIERCAAHLGLAVVAPDACLSSYSDMTHGGKYFTYIADELPEKMRAFFPLSDRREDNFIAGLSMGGGGAVKIGLARPEHYAAIGCLSSTMSTVDNPAVTGHPEWEARLFAAYDGRDLTGTEEDAAASALRILEEGLPAPRIYHACGSEDFMRESAREMRDFFQGIDGNPFDYVYEEAPGAHDWTFWEAHIRRFLDYLGLEPRHGFRG